MSKVSSISEQVKAHSRRIESGQSAPYAQACPRCGHSDRSGSNFSRHDCRRRTFRVVVNGLVEQISSWICRWRCKACGKVFTDYSPFDSRRRTAATHSIPSNNSLPLA